MGRARRRTVVTAPDALALYPFLRSGTAGPDTPPAVDPGALFAEVLRSTVEKAGEIVALREEVCRREGPAIEACAGRMTAAFRTGGRLFTFGNGGSATDAAAVAGLFLSPDPPARPLPAMSLAADSALLTALANDVGFEVVFARQLAAYGGAGDIALGLSTSGGSVNVLRGFAEARRLGMLTVGLAGSGGGAMAEASTIDHLFAIPSASVHRVQEAQSTVYQVLWELVQQALTEPV
jgi:D-sedoheptulose 7-phosphate isomerase